MADRYEFDLLSREYNDIDISTDYLRTLDENGVSFRDDMARIAKAFIEQYNESTLADTERSVQQAFADIYGDVVARTATVAELEEIEEILGI